MRIRLIVGRGCPWRAVRVSASIFVYAYPKYGEMLNFRRGFAPRSESDRDHGYEIAILTDTIFDMTASRELDGRHEHDVMSRPISR